MSKNFSKDCLEEDFQKGEYAEDLQKFADNCIGLFFKNKVHESGRLLEDSELFTDFTQKTVLYTQFDDYCFDFIHEVCLPLIPVDPSYKEKTVTWPVHCLIGLLNEIKKINIPKDFQPGLLLLYFKFYYDVDIPLYPLV